MFHSREKKILNYQGKEVLMPNATECYTHILTGEISSKFIIDYKDGEADKVQWLRIGSCYSVEKDTVKGR